MAQPEATTVPALSVRDLVKSFPGVVANDHVSLDLQPGEIHAVLGENGAGKSTLMEVTYGRYAPDSGTMRLFGQPYAPQSARDAIVAGIGMVHQHFLLIEAFSVAQNIVLGAEPGGGPWFRSRVASEAVAALAKRYALEVDPDAVVRDLPVGLRQRVEILKAFYRNARVLILDEPTAALTVGESQELFAAMRGFAAQGIAIAFVTHKLDEVMQVADRVSVMRRGQMVLSGRPVGETNAAELARLMIGRDLAPASGARAAGPGEAALEVRAVSTTPELGAPGLSEVELTVRAGEIVGLAGVEGNGQPDLVAALTGTKAVRSGEILLGGRSITHASAAARVDLGLAVIPADRQRDGLVLTFTVAENIALRHFRRPPLSRGPLLDWSEIRRRAKELVEEFDVRPPDPGAYVMNLSGGNQQKVILAREVSGSPTAVVAAQPTRGLDILATDFVHQRLRRLRDRGAAVLLVSLDLDEIFALSDRVAVMVRGRIVGWRDTSATTKEEVGALMLSAIQERPTEGEESR
jgi:ABC-type uncharacterized transport system ATPase subunit